MINQLALQSRVFADQFFDANSDLKPGDQLFVECLQNDGLPMAYEFYREGFRTREDILKIDTGELSNRKDIDPKTLEALVQYQAKIRNRTRSRPS